MGLGRALFLGDYGNWLDTDDNRRRMEYLARRMKTKHAIDRSQNERIAALEAENEELKLYVGLLVELLEKKGVIAGTELGELMPSADEVSDEPSAEGEQNG